MAPSSRPTGTLSFLFTDIEGSTGLWERQPEAMRQALEQHDAILRAAIEGYDGYVFSTAGDAFSAAFRRPLDAARSAVDAQRRLLAESWPTTVPLRVRMGIHVGAAQERDGDYFGPALNRAARLMALGHGGQVLVSLAAEELLRDELPVDASLRGLGAHVLRGLSRPELIFQLAAQGLAVDFPALGAAMSVPNNLPTPPTSFVGRADDLRAIVKEIGAHRLVTLVGPGGVGKTRLSLEAAGAATDLFPDGIWFIELAPLTEADAVTHAVAAALSLGRSEGLSLLESIVTSLEDRRVLLVVDNCEHVIDAVSGVVDRIRRATSGVSVLATSRQPLGLAGERIWDVDALDSQLDGPELFCQRAEAASRGFARADDNGALIADICRQLDGVPLAIELAASRVRSMSLAQLSRGLDDRFRLLRSAGRGAVERHQTLQATVEWSYRLLSDAERLIFNRLSVFAGSFDLAAAEAVCGTEPLDTLDVVELLSSLVDKSLLLLDTTEIDARYRLLETLRQFGQRQVTDQSAAVQLRNRHLGHFAEVARTARQRFEGSANAVGRATYEWDWDNLRTALEWAIETGAADVARQLVKDSFSFAWWTSRVEHDDWAQKLVGPDGPPDPELLAIAGLWMMYRGDREDYLAGEALGLRAIAAAPAPDDPAAALGGWTVTAARWFAGRAEEAWEAHRAARRAATNHSNSFIAAMVIAWSSPSLMFEPEALPGLVAAASARMAGIDNATMDAYLSYHRGNASLAVGDIDGAMAHWSRCAHVAARSGDQQFEIGALSVMAVRAPSSGSDDHHALYREALERIQVVDACPYRSFALTGLAFWWADTGRLEDAACILGFLSGQGEGYAGLADLRASAIRLVEQDPRSAGRRAEGEAMTGDEIVAFALDRLDSPG